LDPGFGKAFGKPDRCVLGEYVKSAYGRVALVDSRIGMVTAVPAPADSFSTTARSLLWAAMTVVCQNLAAHPQSNYLRAERLGQHPVAVISGVDAIGEHPNPWHAVGARTPVCG
jgi:hypothetical protein